MGLQIYGKAKCFETKKAERYFKERGLKFQSVDLLRFGMSRGELQSVCRALGGPEALLDPNAKGEAAALLPYLLGDEAKLEKLLENQNLLKTPIVRNGRQATAGYCPEVWKNWAL